MLEKRKLELISERNRLLAIVNADEDRSILGLPKVWGESALWDLEDVDLELAEVTEAIEEKALNNIA